VHRLYENATSMGGPGTTALQKPGGKRINRSEDRDCNKIVVVRDFDIPLKRMDRSSRQKTSKEILDVNYTLYQMNNTYIQNTSYNRSRMHIVLKCTQNCSTNHKTVHKTSVNKHRKTEVIFSKFQQYETKN
jgi:hypothetical protein